jgi:hypothetical protein
MTQPEPSEEASHFEQVLGRLDALLKRKPSDAAAPDHDLANLSEVADSNVPVLLDIYDGETATLRDNAKGLPTPLLTEPVAVIGQEVEQGSSDAAVDRDMIVERTVTLLLPQLQETLDRIVGEEVERVLGQIRAGVAERLHGELMEKVEHVLRERLREALKVERR